jgi:hypothetical protein
MRAHFQLIATVVVGLTIVMGAGVVRAGDEGTAQSSKAQKARGPGAGDENIKSRSPKNDPAAQAVAPPEKGGKATRQSICRLHVDNRSQWKVQIYVDGDYAGLMSPYGDSVGYYSCETHSVFGLAEFRDGPDITWGPTSLGLPGTWTLNP